MFTPGDEPNPSHGGNGYGLHVRNFVDSMTQGNNLPAANNHFLLHLDQARAMNGPHQRTQHRWQAPKMDTGSIAPLARTGNNRALVLRGTSLVALATYRSAFPKATRDEIRAFLYNCFCPVSNEEMFFSKTSITRAEQRLGLSRKKGSTTARQANSIRNRIRL